ncbi:GNAT family N-acetyltransferase [Hyphomicrobium sp.]|uniref:GNAT family N-acetyltransferase n=1 Tax=Hyphomicrobium sp. TaxID=82 RepID=UPI0035636922
MAEIEVRIHEGSRDSLLPLFRMADESESEVLTYYEMGNVLVAYERGAIVGLAHVVEEAGALEIVNLAVVPQRRGKGIGKRLIEEAARFSRLSNTRRLVVCTGAWETSNIIFYLKRGFRIFNVVQNFFTSEKGYDLAVRDQVQFEMTV